LIPSFEAAIFFLQCRLVSAAGKGFCAMSGGIFLLFEETKFEFSWPLGDIVTALALEGAT